MPGDIQCQVEWDTEQPDGAAGVPLQCGGIGPDNLL